MQKQKNQAFTLVELIVVITILAILGTIAFISLQGYSKSARNSRRIADISNIKTSLELFILNSGVYPLPDNGEQVTYSGDLLRTQGIIGENVTKNLSKNLNKKPTDPLLETEYTYSTTNTKKEYQILSYYEGELSFSPHPNPLPMVEGTKLGFINQVNASSNYIPKVEGNYNEVFVKSPNYIIPVPSIINSEIQVGGIVLNGTNIKSQMITNGENILGDIGEQGNQTGALEMNFIPTGNINKDSTSTEKENAITAIQLAYTGTIFANKDIYKNIFNTIDKESLANVFILKLSSNTSSNSLITQTDCINAGWFWVNSENDVYIGTTQGKGFCISPRFGDWNSDSGFGNGGISWNGWGNIGVNYFNGWDGTGIGDTGNPISGYGQTRILDSENPYNCKSLGTANSDYDTNDTILGRMKWLATNGNSYDEARNIDWIIGLVPHTVGTYPHVIPALYIADCIDGVKDLTKTMIYIHNNNIEEITYTEYSTDVILNTDNAYLNDITYQNRQKYLIAWTQKSGSHLPSVMSYITNGYASANDSDGDLLTGTDRGEYQIACELNLLTDADDDIHDEWIWTSNIGNYDGTNWGRSIRGIGAYGCSNQSYISSGNHYLDRSARFVIRP